MGVLSTPQHDFGEHYKWKTFSEGMEGIEKENKPGIVVIAKRFSGACKDFARSMSTNAEMIRLSNHFVMILALDEDEPQEEKWLPGNCFHSIWVVDSRSRYYPRVFFVNVDKSIDYNTNNAGFSPVNHFYYYDAHSVAESAKRYLDNHSYVEDIEELYFEEEL